MAEACPRCGYPAVTDDKCPQCNVVVSLYRASLEKLRRGPGTSGTSAAPPPAAATVAAPAAAGGSAGVRKLRFHGSAMGLFGIQAINALLTLLTLGVFYFWAKTRVRRYVMGETELEGDRFAYHGTGRELLVGFAKGVAIFIIPTALLTILPEIYQAPAEVRSSLRSLLWLVGLLVVPVAMVGARRYRLSRMSWRGIRFSFRGGVRQFVGIFVVGTILTSLTLGLYYPVFVTQRQAFMVSHAYFGSRKFDFEGAGRDLLKPFLVMLLLFVPTLGTLVVLVRGAAAALLHGVHALRRHAPPVHDHGGAAGVAADQQRAGHRAERRVVVAVDGGAQSGVHAAPHVAHGPLELEGIHQDARAASAVGEGLAGLLDADFGV
jgi:hypothetical protein